MRYELLDCRPVPASESGWIGECLRESGATLSSALRTPEAVAFARAHGCSLSSQVELWNGWINHLPGFNPANPPGFSTHELRSDGIAFPQWTRGLPIPPWAVGLDIDDPHVAAFCVAARRHGWIVTITYPGSPSEYHHVNARKEPILHVFKPIELGSHGKRVHRLTTHLALMDRPSTHKSYLEWRLRSHKYNKNTVEAVEHFQHDHHLTPDGVVGVHTAAQLRVSWRRHLHHGGRRR